MTIFPQEAGQRRLKIAYERAGDGGWYAYDENTYDGTNEIGHGPTKADALAQLLEQFDEQL